MPGQIIEKISQLLNQKWIYIITLSFALAVILVNFWRNTASTTDENLYINPQTAIYVTSGFPAILKDSLDKNKNIKVALKDSVKNGDFIYEINGKKPKDSLDVNKLIEESRNDENIEFNVLGQIGNNIEYFSYSTRKDNLPDNFFRTIPSCAYVVSVVEGGASDRAGIRPGDVILKVNGRNFQGIDSEDRILRHETIGSSINYTILRNDKEI